MTLLKIMSDRQDVQVSDADEKLPVEQEQPAYIESKIDELTSIADGLVADVESLND